MQVLPQYQSHKVVSAAKIASTFAHGDEATLFYIGPEGQRIGLPVSAEYVQRNNPQVGGYYVRYSNGHESWSPAEAFEEGYVPVPEDDPLPDALMPPVYLRTGDVVRSYHDTPVLEFHQAYGLPVSFDPTSVPGPELRVLRVRLLAEELAELARATGVELWVNSRAGDGHDVIATVDPLGAYDPIEAADAVADIKYLADGTNVAYGFDGTAVMTEVHRSNMSKLGPDRKPIYREDGKVLKGPNYFKPDIRSVLFGRAPEGAS